MSKQKILLADDSVTIQKVVNLTFADEGIEVISVGDGDSAMEKILETTPDLIMADVNMPGLTGYEICEKLKNSQAFSQTPVILLVGSFEPFDEDEAKRVGADDYLTKPFQSIRQLVQKVTALLSEEKSNGYIAQDEVQPELSPAFVETPQSFPPIEEKFEDTLEDYPVSTEKDDFGDVTSDDEMIQTSQFPTSQFPAFTKTETPKFESSSISDAGFKDDYSSEDAKPIVDDEPKPYIPIEHNDEIKPFQDEQFAYKPLEQNDEIKPFQDEISSYTPIASAYESEPIAQDEPVPYIPVEHESEVRNESEALSTEEVPSFDEVSFTEKNEIKTDTHEVGLPEMASALTLDEQNLLEIAPREEDFIIDMDHEQNISADWDLIETPDFANSQASVSSNNDDVKHFALVTEEPVPVFEENIGSESLESESSINTSEETVKSNEFVEKEASVETEEKTQDITPDESIETAAVTETEKENSTEVETEKKTLSVENVVSVPNFIASTVVSEVAKEKLEVSEQLIEVIVNRVMERLSDNVVREIAWEIVPSQTDLIVKKMVQEKLDKD